MSDLGYFMDGVWHGKHVHLDGADSITMHVPPVPPSVTVVKPLPLREGMPTVTYRADRKSIILTSEGAYATPLWEDATSKPE